MLDRFQLDLRFERTTWLKPSRLIYALGCSGYNARRQATLSGAFTDYGINDAFMKELAANLKSGDAALFVLIQNMTADRVLKEIQGAGGTVLKTSLDDAKESALREALAKAAVTQTPPPAVNAS